MIELLIAFILLWVIFIISLEPHIDIVNGESEKEVILWYNDFLDTNWPHKRKFKRLFNYG